MDAVEQTVHALEDDPLYNAGVGAVFNAEGKHELDASIMDGSTGLGGGVAAVTTVKNPISLARLVMTETRHVLLIGEGAEKFADEMKDRKQIRRVPNDHFSTDARRKEWEEELNKIKKSPACQAAPWDRGVRGARPARESGGGDFDRGTDKQEIRPGRRQPDPRCWNLCP